MKVAFPWRGTFLIGASMIASSPASAHHAMGGQLPSTFMQGLLSGLAHPVIGPDHLAFIIAIGVAAALVPAGLGLVAAFIAASTAGVFIHTGAITIPHAEIFIAGSVIAAAALISRQGGKTSMPWLALAASGGVLHGYAFAESIVGAEANVLGAYLLGLALVSAAIAVGVTWTTRTIASTKAGTLQVARASSIILSVVGVALVASTLLAA
ncbi:MAG: HupE/UreJ family protein [Hyphomicrobiaceae bacterium]